VVVIVDVLFAETGSGGDVELTVAVSLAAPLAVGFTVIVTVAVAPAANDASAHVTLAFAAEHVPCDVVELP